MEKLLIPDLPDTKEELIDLLKSQVEKSPIPDLPNTKEKLIDLLGNEFEVLRRGEVVSAFGGVYLPGGIAVSNIDLKCPFCSREFTAVQKSGCFGGDVSPSSCPNCNFPNNVYNALGELLENKEG